MLRGRNVCTNHYWCEKYIAISYICLFAYISLQPCENTNKLIYCIAIKTKASAFLFNFKFNRQINLNKENRKRYCSRNVIIQYKKMKHFSVLMKFFRGVQVLEIVWNVSPENDEKIKTNK